MLHPYIMPLELSSIFYYLKLNSGIEHSSLAKGDLLGICHLLFQLHGGMVSHMQVIATPSSTAHNTK